MLCAGMEDDAPVIYGLEFQVSAGGGGSVQLAAAVGAAVPLPRPPVG